MQKILLNNIDKFAQRQDLHTAEVLVYCALSLYQDDNGCVSCVYYKDIMSLTKLSKSGFYEAIRTLSVGSDPMIRIEKTSREDFNVVLVDNADPYASETSGNKDHAYITMTSELLRSCRALIKKTSKFTTLRRKDGTNRRYTHINGKIKGKREILLLIYLYYMANVELEHGHQSRRLEKKAFLKKYCGILGVNKLSLTRYLRDIQDVQKTEKLVSIGFKKSPTSRSTLLYITILDKGRHTTHTQRDTLIRYQVCAAIRHQCGYDFSIPGLPDQDRRRRAKELVESLFENIKASEKKIKNFITHKAPMKTTIDIIEDIIRRIPPDRFQRTIKPNYINYLMTDLFHNVRFEG